MKKLIALGILAFLVAGIAEANPFYKNRKHVYDKNTASGSKIFYTKEPAYNPSYVYHNIRTDVHYKRGLVNVKMKKKLAGPMAKNVKSFRNSPFRSLELPALLVLFRTNLQ